MGSCPRNSIIYNATGCACSVGQLLNRTTNSCGGFNGSLPIVSDSVVEYSGLSFPETILDFDQIRKVTQSQAVFLEATLVMLLSWLVFCFFLRFMKLGDGRNIWFRLRWWISRFDISFATRHWLDDQKVVVKRKTELGGTFSIASWILFIGLLATLFYQIITKRTIAVHNVKATNAPDLMAFVNDMDFNITTISSMSCSNLRGLGTVVVGQPGFFDQRSGPLSEFVNYSCRNTSIGPTISFRCSKCRFVQDYMCISWSFVDLPNNPAAAVGFYFNLTAKNHDSKKHLSFVSGTLKNGSAFDERPVTFRGIKTNILKFNLFPRLYRNLHDLRLIQPLFHEFVPGSNVHETTQLQASLQNSNEGLVNITLYIHYLSAYMVEIENQNIMGPVSFLADLGGLYCFSIGIFFYLLVQCEFRIKRLRNEDSILRSIRNRRKAQQHWDKLRKYVIYTWGCKALDDDNNNTDKVSACGSFMNPSTCGNGFHHRSGSSRKLRQQGRTDTLRLNRKPILANEKNSTPDSAHTQEVKSFAGTASNTKGQKSDPKDEPALKYEVLGSTEGGKKRQSDLHEKDVSQMQAASLTDNNIVPAPPALDLKGGSELDVNDIRRNFQHLYNYNVMLREKLTATQSLVHSLAAKSSSAITETHK